MIKRTLFAAFAGAAILAFCGTASANTLVFSPLSVTVGPTDSFSIGVTLTLDPSAPALISNGSGQLTSGYTDADVTANLFGTPCAPMACSGTVDVSTDSLSVNTNEGIGLFPFPYSVGLGGNFSFASNLDVQPNTPTFFSFLTFTPSPTPVPTGTYTFQTGNFFLQVFDNTVTDPNNGNSPAHIADINLASITAPLTINVVGTPEPGTCVLVFGGLAAAIVRRRKRA